MASQIAHVIYAKKFFDALDSGQLLNKLSDEERESYPIVNLNKDEFILGATFPDIRRIDPGIKRNYTHMYFPKLNLDFSGSSFFEAGWKFHLWCDMKREEILNNHDFFSIEGADDFWGLPGKLLEDEIVYDNYNNWEKLCAYFNNPPYIESLDRIDKETFNLWYAILARYMERKPDDKSMRVFLLKQPSNAPQVKDIRKSVDKLRANKKVLDILGKIQQEII